jgi:hypothetical protein
MTARVSSLEGIVVGDYRYVFLLIIWNSYDDGVREELRKQSDAFGGDMRSRGLVVSGFQERSFEIYEQVIAKNWPEEVADRMENEDTPFMVVMTHDFANFDPGEHPWAIIWFSDFSVDPSRIRPFLGALAAKVRKDEDVLLYLKEIAARDHVGRAGMIARYFEIKPQIFGVSVDVGAILSDLAGAAGRA